MSPICLFSVLPVVKKPVELFIANDNVTVNGEYTDLKNVKVKGSASHDEYAAFRTEFVPYYEKLNNQAKLISTETDAARKNEQIKAYTGMREDIMNATMAFLKKKPNSPVSAYMLVC